jgi:hypothetical protein
MLLLHDDGRSWVSAVTGYTSGTTPSSTAPFDFVHLSLQDLRELEQVKPKDFQKLLAPPRPSPRDGGYKWMQFSYTVTAAADPPAAGSPSIELFGKAI